MILAEVLHHPRLCRMRPVLHFNPVLLSGRRGKADRCALRPDLQAQIRMPSGIGLARSHPVRTG